MITIYDIIKVRADNTDVYLSRNLNVGLLLLLVMEDFYTEVLRLWRNLNLQFSESKLRAEATWINPCSEQTDTSIVGKKNR